MPNQFFSPEGDLENYFVDEYWLIDQYIGDKLWVWGYNGYGGNLGINSAATIISVPVTTFAGGTDWKQVSLGRYNTYAIKTDGTLWSWGRNINGAVGDNSTIDRSTPVTTFSGGTDWKQVSAGQSFTLAIKTDGTLWVWGYNAYTGTGYGFDVNSSNISTPVTTFAGGSDWKQVRSSWFHTLAVKTDGTLWSWGDNRFGQLGRGNPNLAQTYYRTPITTFAGGNNWADAATTNPEDLYTLSGGGNHNVAIKTDGTLWVWGRTIGGRLGNNTNIRFNVSVPVTTFSGGTNWKQVSAGSNYTTAIKTDGTLWVWGNGSLGKLGTNDSIDRFTPVTTFTGGTNWKQVSAGNNNIAAIKTDGTLWIWGNCTYGRLGNGITTGDISTPITTFAGGTDWKQVSSSGFYTAAIKTDGTLWTWGFGSLGRLGNFSTTIRSTPITTFAGGTNWKQVSVADSHTSAIKTDGTLWTWGYGGDGRLGNGIANGNRSTPVTTFAGGTDWVQVVSRSNFTASVKTDGTLWVWGANNVPGKLGTNDMAIRSTPVTTFAGGTNWRQVNSSGYVGIIAIRGNGINNELYLTGNNDNGQLGINIDPELNIMPGKVGDSTNWKQVTTGRYHSAAIKTDGTLWTWGASYDGKLGDNNVDGIERVTPITTFAGGTDWKYVESGANHVLAIKTNGTLWAWGNGDYGQLGTGPVAFRNTPVTTFAGGTNWADTATGAEDELYTIGCTGDIGAAIKTDGTLWVWGDAGTFTLIGTNDFIKRSTPVTTFSGGTDWKQLTIRNTHSAAIKTDGTLWTWGDSNNGRLGNGITTGYIVTPITTFAGGTNWKQVSSGVVHTAAIKTDGTLWTWGVASAGRLGNGLTTGLISTPITTFAGGTNWKQVSSGFDYIAAIKTDGTLWTWGTGGQGRLGNASTINVSTPVTTFAGGTNWKQVSSGDSHVTAIKTDGTLWTWGNASSGKLGTGVSAGNISTPVTTFAGGTNWKQVTTGRLNTAAIKTDGTLWTWGDADYGALGDLSTYATALSANTPVTTFAGGNNWKQVSAGDLQIIAIRGESPNLELYLFGYNYSGFELGIGGLKGNVPEQVYGNSTNWKQVSGSYGASIAIKTDGTLWTWGYNSSGELGTNVAPDFTYRIYTPVTTFAGGNDWKQACGAKSHVAAITSGINPNLPLS